MTRRIGLAGVLVMILLAACQNGSGETPSSPPNDGDTVASASASSTLDDDDGGSEPASSAASPPTSEVPSETFPLCPEVDLADIQGLTACIHADLVAFWEAETGKPIERPVVVEPEFPPEPRECFAPQQYYAWYCSDNQTIYLNTSMLELWRDHFTESEVPYSLAATMAHEVGHAAQFALRPELAELDTRDPEISLPIETEADCLAGVWAAGPIAEGRLDRERLERVWSQQTELLNDEEHQQTHGPPQDRVARLIAGIDGGVDACWQDES